MIYGDLQTARAHFFRALGDRTRLDILKMLRPGKPLTVTEIYQNLGQAQNLVSHHLACLKNCGMVIAKKEGKQVFYQLRNKKGIRLINLTDAYIKDVLESVLFCEEVSDDEEIRKSRRKTA